jgi:enoyl-CoA hydratase/carnithine racemase
MVNGGDKSPGRIEAEKIGPEFHIRIANPDRLNAMSLAMWEDLASKVKQADTDNSVRVVVLQGDGNKAFASGADISEFATQRNNPEQSARFSAAVAAAQQALSACQHPTVALIKGICMGGGMTLSIACDLRYSAGNARFRMPAGRLGLGYGLNGIKRFTQILGPARTAELFFTARTFDGHEAARIGLVHEVFDNDVFALITQQRLDAIADLAPLTLRAAKDSIRHILDEPDAPDEATVREEIQACYQSDDYIEGQQAFMEKRSPRFKAR